MPTPETNPPVEDPEIADPKHYKLEFENEKVRVLRVKFGPKEKSPMVKISSMVTVSLTDRDIKIVLPGGRAQRVFGKAGEVGWYEAREHSPENMSDQPYEGIHILLKDHK
jgi:hypothetical protein